MIYNNSSKLIELNKIYKYQKRLQMSRILSKKVNKTPARSPSPDVAHRNIIKVTPSPSQDALMKMRISRTSKSPLGRGFSSNQQYEAHIDYLQEQLKQLNTQNSILRHEIDNKSKQIDFLKEMNFNYQKRQASSRSHSRIGHQDRLGEYQARIVEMSQQVQRVHGLLTKDRSTIQKLMRQNEDLKHKNKRSPKISEFDGMGINQELLQLQKKLNHEFKRQLSQYQLKVQQILDEQEKKLNRVQRNQKKLLNDLQNKRYGSPMQNIKPKPDLSTSHLTPSPKQLKKSGDLAINKHIQCQNCKIYLQRIAQLEAELNVKSFYANTSSKSNKNTRVVPASLLQEYLQKLQEIKMILNNEQIQQSINHIQTNLNDIFSIEQKFEYMKQQKNNIIQQLREKQVQQSLEIVKLKKENQLFKNQVQEQMAQIQKLKEIIETIPKSREEPKTKRKKQTNQGNILRKYIVEAIQRIQNLENQIGDTLKN